MMKTIAVSFLGVVIGAVGGAALAYVLCQTPEKTIVTSYDGIHYDTAAWAVSMAMSETRIYSKRLWEDRHFKIPSDIRFEQSFPSFRIEFSGGDLGDAPDQVLSYFTKRLAHWETEYRKNKISSNQAAQTIGSEASPQSGR